MNKRTAQAIRLLFISFCFMSLVAQHPISVWAQSYLNTSPVAMAGSIEDRPRILFVTLDRNVWIAYDTELGNLYRVWMGGLEDPSLSSPSFLAESPSMHGVLLLENKREQQWRIIRKGEVSVPDVSFLGYRWIGDQLTLEYALDTPYGQRVLVTERPHLTLDREHPVLKRSFTLFNVPEDVQVGLEVAVEKIKQLSDLAIEGTFHRYGEKKHSFYWGSAIDVYGRLQLSADTTTSLSITFSPGIIANTENNTELETSTIPRLRPILAMDSEGVQPILRRRSDHEIGISMKVYGIGEPIEKLAELAPGQLPNVNKVVPRIDLSQKEQFGGLDFYFITHLSGYLNVAAPGDFAFKVLADDGIRLSIADSVLLEKDELQAAQPSDGRSIYLTAGIHPIEVEHFQSTGRKQLTVMWQPPWSNSFEVLEAPVLSTRKEEQRFASTSRKYIKRPLIADSLRIGQVVVNNMHPAILMEEIPVPELEGFVGGLDVLSSGRLVATTWNGDGRVAIIDGDFDVPSSVTIKEIASGLNIPLGLEVVDDEIFVLQQHELTQLIDNDGNELIDEYRVVSNNWEVSTDYTELAVGLEYIHGYFLSVLGMPLDRSGAILIEDIHHRGVLVRIGFDGSQRIVGMGMQLSGGISLDDDKIAVSDQRNPWFSDSRVLFMSSSSEKVGESNEPGYTELSSIWLPLNPSHSPTQPFFLSKGAYEGNWLVGDMILGQMYRMALDEVNQQVQGAVFPFAAGLPASMNRIVELQDGSFLAGGISLQQPWGGVLNDKGALFRVRLEDEQAFEMKEIRAVTGGFDVEFTKMVDPDYLNSKEIFTLYQWPNSETRRDRTRKRSGRKELVISSAKMLDDGVTVRLNVDGLQPGHIVYFNIDPNLMSAKNERLWSNEAWYSLNLLPSSVSGAP